MPRIGIKLEIVADDTKLLCDEKQCRFFRRHKRDSYIASCALFTRPAQPPFRRTGALEPASDSDRTHGPVLRMQTCHAAELSAPKTHPYARAEQVKVGDVIYDIGTHASRPHKVLRVDPHEKTYKVGLLLELLETDGVDASMWKHTVTTWKNTCVRIRIPQ